jgi:hypothetical protein
MLLKVAFVDLRSSVGLFYPVPDAGDHRTYSSRLSFVSMFHGVEVAVVDVFPLLERVNLPFYLDKLHVGGEKVLVVAV